MSLCHHDSVVFLLFKKHTGLISETGPSLFDHDLAHQITITGNLKISGILRSTTLHYCLLSYNILKSLKSW